MSSSLLQVKPKFCKSLLVAFYCPCLLIFTSCFQYEQLNGGSEEKLRALREIKETVQHRKHLDSSIDFIGRLIFGFENGPKMLETVRAYGEPLVDDWDCLKRMVSTLISLIRLWHKARMKFPFLTQLRCLRTCIRFIRLCPVELISSRLPLPGEDFRIPVRVAHSIRHEVHEGICEHLQQRYIRDKDEGVEHQCLRRLQPGEVEPFGSGTQRLMRCSL